MGLAAKKMEMYREGMSKREFEKAWMEMMDRVHVIDEKVSKKADEVVLTMVLSHRQEIEHLQSECIRLNQELRELQKRQKQQMNEQVVEQNESKKNLWQRLFRR
ncbi:hypothetical protein [Pontibacillus marinus]|uniref:Uncharacterized protein n=1 Tax=Pontibacillus marinus BH030004 = DSM 16465 TaxID=1385511 RepID=A0A0A5G0J1_9BACI|nr:hypothetical protein [Pontibacillus marinus]KGX85544.1 hypothetical protein N783_14455 [Pontibacillus marinus BH030004 = DSM 16465]